jgi:hypothetical protein
MKGTKRKEKGVGKQKEAEGARGEKNVLASPTVVVQTCTLRLIGEESTVLSLDSLLALGGFSVGSWRWGPGEAALGWTAGVVLTTAGGEATLEGTAGKVAAAGGVTVVGTEGRNRFPG